MGKTVALISGKGGSGKTSLALTLSLLLSEAKIKTLIIDCDFATNGLTFFYEDQLQDIKNVATCLEDIIFSSNMRTVDTQVEFVRENDYLYILPSIKKISGLQGRDYLSRRDCLANYINRFLSDFDMVIFDCQAGYSEFLETILPNSDTVLFITEPDAISTTAIRALHLKVGSLLEAKTYQVFSKVPSDEFDIYRKLTSVTLFTNLASLKFDWKIRKAFALAKLPVLSECQMDYLDQLYDIAMIVCKGTKKEEDLKKYGIKLEKMKLDAEENEIDEKIKQLKIEKKTNPRDVFYAASMLSTLAILFAAFIIPASRDSNYMNEMPSITTIAAIAVALFLLILFYSFIVSARYKNRQYRSYLSIKNRINIKRKRLPTDYEEMFESMEKELVDKLKNMGKYN